MCADLVSRELQEIKKEGILSFKCIAVSFQAFTDRKGLTQATSFISVWTWAAAFASLVGVWRLESAETLPRVRPSSTVCV